MVKNVKSFLSLRPVVHFSSNSPSLNNAGGFFFFFSIIEYREILQQKRHRRILMEVEGKLWCIWGLFLMTYTPPTSCKYSREFTIFKRIIR